jgi:predicted secreted protein
MAIRSAKGTLQKLGGAASPVIYATIGQVRSISGPTTTATVQDVTTHSTSGNWMEKLATLIDPGNLSFPINYDAADTTHQFLTGLWNLFINLTVRYYRTVFPASIGYMQYQAYVTGHGFDVPVDNVLQSNIELTVFGAITAANGAEP